MKDSDGMRLLGVESSLYAKKMAGPIGHRREKEMKREQIAKYIHEI